MAQTIEERNAKAKERWEKNKERYSAVRAEWERKNATVLADKRRARREADLELARKRARQHQKKYREGNPDQISTASRRRSKRMVNAQPGWFEADKVDLLYKKRNELNQIYDLQGNDMLVVDHVIPLNPRSRDVCGLHCWANLQLLTRSENSSKGDTFTTDW